MPTPRKLHAAIAELDKRPAAVTPTVALELAANGHAPTIVNGVSSAEHALKTHSASMSVQARNRLKQDAWWAQVWRDPRSPYQLVELNEDEDHLAKIIARSFPRECFVTAGKAELTEHRDTRIVAEALAVGATLLLTSNAHTIKRAEINDWAVKHGRRLGFKPKPVVADADATIGGWLKRDNRRETVLQAALMACWPAANDAEANTVIANAIAAFSRLGGQDGGRLRGSSAAIAHILQNHREPFMLVEQARSNLPSAVIETDRNHPTYRRRPSENSRSAPKTGPNTKNWSR